LRGREAGANDYMVKPFKPEELRARIRRLVKK
jgi:DNA-binding response OmpR family regulator